MLRGDIDQVQAVLKLDSRNNLCHHIGRVVNNIDLLKQYISFIQNFSNKIKPDINVLGTSMMSKILHQTDRTRTITENSNMLLRNPQVIAQTM